MFKVTMTNLGREHATEMRSFENEPDGEDLYNMAANHLLSGGIRFSVHSGNPDESVYPVSGHILAGAHQVGEFKVEEVSE